MKELQKEGKWIVLEMIKLLETIIYEKDFISWFFK